MSNSNILDLVTTWASDLDGFVGSSSNSTNFNVHRIEFKNYNQDIVKLFSLFDLPKIVESKVKGLIDGEWITIKFCYHTGEEVTITLFLRNDENISNVVTAIAWYLSNYEYIKTKVIVHEAKRFLSSDISEDERRSYIEFPIVAGQRPVEPDNIEQKFWW